MKTLLLIILFYIISSSLLLQCCSGQEGPQYQGTAGSPILSEVIQGNKC